ncbi:MAG: hypothetical protein AAGE65_03875 [Planctomycetota bacterium]
MKFAPAAVSAPRFARPVAVVSTAVLLLTLAGCDQSAKDRGEAARLLNQGIAEMLEADTAKAEAGQRLSDVRIALLADAVSPLEQAANIGAPEQKAQANMLLARIEAQSAEALGRDAAAGASQTRLAFVGLLSQLDSIESLGSTALIAQRDPEQAIAQMDEAIAGAETKQSELATQVDALRSKVATLDAEITRQQEAARGAFALKTQRESDAFVQSGDEKYDTLREATAAQRTANAADIEAQELTIERDQVAAELAMAERGLTLAEESLDHFLDTREAFTQAGQDAERIVRELRDQQTELIEALGVDLEAQVNAFDQVVTGPIGQAAQRAEAAVGLVTRAGSGLRGADQRQQRLEALDKLHLQTQILADAVAYHADLNASLKAVAGRAAFEQAPELRETIDGLAGDLAAAAQAFREQAGEALAATQQQLETLGEDNEAAAGTRDAVARLATLINAG